MTEEALVTDEAVAQATQPEPEATAAQPAPDEQQPDPPALVMIEAEDVQGCAVDGTCW